MLTILENMRRMNRRYNKKRGSALIMVMMTMAVIFTVGTSMVALTLSSFSTSLAETGREKSYGAALAVSETVKNNLDTILKKYPLEAEKGSKVTMKWQNDLSGNAGGLDPYMIIDGAKVSVDLEVTDTATRPTPDGGSRVVPSEIVVNVRSSCRSQESYISFRAYSESESKQTLLDTYKNSFIMGGDLGGPRRDPNLVIRRIDGDIGIDCRADKMDSENHDIVTRYFNPTVLYGITGSVSANGDIIVGGEDNIVKIRGNLYVDGNLTIRGLDLGCDLPGIWRKDFNKKFGMYRTVANGKIGDIEIMGTDANCTDRYPDKPVVNEAMYGQMVPGGKYVPLQVYYEVSHRYLIDRDITEFWTKSYTRENIASPWVANVQRVDLYRDGGNPLEDYYGAVMYTSPDCDKMYDMYPKGGNIFCTGDIIVDRCNSGMAGWPDLAAPYRSKDINIYEVDPDGRKANKRVPNQSIVRGDVFCYGRMIVAPTNLFSSDLINRDTHSPSFINGRQFVDGYLNTTMQRATRKTEDWRKSVLNIINDRKWTGENEGYKICTYERFKMVSEGDRTIQNWSNVLTAEAFKNKFITEYGKKKTAVKNGLINKLARTINESPYEFDAMVSNESGLRRVGEADGKAYYNGKCYKEATRGYVAHYEKWQLDSWVNLKDSSWSGVTNTNTLKAGDLVFLRFVDGYGNAGKYWLKMTRDGSAAGVGSIWADSIGYSYDNFNDLRTILFGEKDSGGNICSGGNIYIANYNEHYSPNFERKNNVGKVGEWGGSYWFHGKQIKVPGGKVVVNESPDTGDTTKTIVHDTISGGAGTKYFNGLAKYAGKFDYGYTERDLNSWVSGISWWKGVPCAGGLKKGDYVYVPFTISSGVNKGKPGKCWLQLIENGPSGRSEYSIYAQMLFWSYDNGSTRYAGDFPYTYTVGSLNSWVSNTSTWTGTCVAGLKKGDSVYVPFTITSGTNKGRPGKCWLKLMSDGPSGGGYGSFSAQMLSWSYDTDSPDLNGLDVGLERGFETYYDALTVKLAEIEANTIYADGPVNVIKSDVEGVPVRASLRADRICIDDSDYISSAFVGDFGQDRVSFMDHILTKVYDNDGITAFFRSQERTKENAIKSDSYFDLNDYYTYTGKDEDGVVRNVFVVGVKRRDWRDEIFGWTVIYNEKYLTHKPGDNDTGAKGSIKYENYETVYSRLSDNESKFFLTDPVFIMNRPGVTEVGEEITTEVTIFKRQKGLNNGEYKREVTTPGKGKYVWNVEHNAYIEDRKGIGNVNFIKKKGNWSPAGKITLTETIYVPRGDVELAQGFDNSYAQYNTLSVDITAQNIRDIAQNTGLKFIKLVSDKKANKPESMFAFSDSGRNYSGMYSSPRTLEHGSPLDLFSSTLAFEERDYGMYLNQSNKNFEHPANHKGLDGRYDASVDTVFKEMLGEDFAYIPRYVVEHLDANALEGKIREAMNEHKDDSDYAKYRSHGGGTITRFNDFRITSGAEYKWKWDKSAKKMVKVVKENSYRESENKGQFEADGTNPLKDITPWAALRYHCSRPGKGRLESQGFFEKSQKVDGYLDPSRITSTTDYVNSYMTAGNNSWWLLCESGDPDDSVRVMKFFNTKTPWSYLTCENRFEIDPYDPAHWSTAVQDVKSARTQIEYIIKDNVYFDFGDGDGDGKGYKTQDGKGVVFGANFEERADTLFGATRMKITLDTGDTRDAKKDIYVYINAPDAAVARGSGSRAGLILKKVTWQIKGVNNAYIILVGDTKMDAKTYSLQVVNSLDKPGENDDEQVGTHFISDEYPVFDYGFNVEQSYMTIDMSWLGLGIYEIGDPISRFKFAATPRRDATGKQIFKPCGTMYIVGSGNNELTIGRGGFINGVVMLPHGTYVNESSGFSKWLPPIATSSSSTATIIADRIKITGSNAGQLTFENYAAGRAEDDLNDNNNGVVKIVETSEEKWSFGGYC